jgi:hypothetical protein
MGKESKERINESPMEKVEIFFSNLPESKYISQQHSIIPEGLWLGTVIDFGEEGCIHISKRGDQYGEDTLISISQGEREFFIHTTSDCIIFKYFPKEMSVSIGDNIFELKNSPASGNWTVMAELESTLFLNNFIDWVKDCIEKEEMGEIGLTLR